MYTNMSAKSVLFIEVSSLQGVLIRGVLCTTRKFVHAMSDMNDVMYSAIATVNLDWRPLQFIVHLSRLVVGGYSSNLAKNYSIGQRWMLRREPPYHDTNFADTAIPSPLKIWSFSKGLCKPCQARGSTKVSG